MDLGILPLQPMLMLYSNKGVLEINPFLLGETFCNQSCFPFKNFPIGAKLLIIDPPTVNGSPPCFPLDNCPSTKLNEFGDLILNSSLSLDGLRIGSCLLEVLWYPVLLLIRG